MELKTKQELAESIEIRRIQSSEINQLVKLCKAHADYEGASYDEYGKTEILKRCLFKVPVGIQCWVAAQGSQLLGYVTFVKQFSTWDAGFYLYMDCLYLKPEARGQGVGGRLMQKAKNYAREKGYVELQWQTPMDNEAAIRFYKMMGAQAKRKERFFLTTP